MTEPNAPFVLILEDDEDVARIIQITLQMAGFEAVYATLASRAFEIVKDREPDLLILDIAMPQMSGWQALYRIRAQHPYADFPVIVLTAYDDPFNVLLGEMQSRVYRYLVKPFDPAYLVQTAREAVAVG